LGPIIGRFILLLCGETQSGRFLTRRFTCLLGLEAHFTGTLTGGFLRLERA
jgi:hypothetical protein